MNIKREFLIERQGKQVVLYAGLLDAAHDAGLLSIETELIQVPFDGNKWTAIARATATFKDGRKFTGIGDASPDNVTRMLAQHFIRMSETRAKARALRDALNIGAVTLEELGDTDPDEHPPKRPEPRPTPQQAAAPAPAVELPTEQEWAYYQKLVASAKRLNVEYTTLNDGETSRAKLLEEGRALKERVNEARAKELVAGKKQ